jgi:SagB-type dehydrogenase family enzyme
MTPLVLRFAPGVTLLADGDDAAEATIDIAGGGEIKIAALDPGKNAVLRALTDGATEDELLAARGDEGGPEGRAWVHFTVGRMVSIGLVRRALGDPLLAVVDGIGRAYQPSGRPLPGGPVRVERFAYARAEGGATVLESPRARSRVTFPDWRGPALLFAAAAGLDPEAGELPGGLDRADALALLTLLHQEGFVEPAGGPGATAGDGGTAATGAGAGAPNGPELAAEGAALADPEAQQLAEWEFHDLLFHHRSREGRHRNPYGGTYTYAGVREPLPAVGEAPTGERIPLHRPDLDRLRREDRPFAEVLEERRSWRRPGPQPLTADQLGELLFRTARVRGRRGTENEEVSNRPYPGGGADYELEIYPLVHRVDGLAPGLHHYDPLDHALTRMRDWDQNLEALARGAARKAPPGDLPDVLLMVTARFGRLTFKYRSICYAIALKDVGVLYQTIYLAATAMGLAPCGLGGGDSDAFAALSGLSPIVEPQIGEMMLNTRDPDEVAANDMLPSEPARGR